MAEGQRRASAATRLTPEEIANRGFASAFRGISETEVRNFLRRVADEVTALREHEEELAGRVSALQEQLREPPPVTEQQLLEALGEETARVLRSAQEAAEDIRSRAEERAATLLREAQEEASRLRDETRAHAARVTEEAAAAAQATAEDAATHAHQAREEAERLAAEVRELAARDAAAARERASAEAAASVEAASAEGRQMVGEAKAVRERILADLARRRSLLHTQLDELRAGRDRLLDGYRVVKRTLAEATEALTQLEARAATELAAPPPPVALPAVEGEDAFAPATGGRGTDGQGAAEAPAHAPPEEPAEAPVDVPTEATVEVPAEVPAEEDQRATPDDGVPASLAPSTGEPAPADEPEPRSGPDVDALFAKLRAGTAPAPDEATAAVDAPDSSEPAPEDSSEPAPEDSSEPAPEDSSEPAPEDSSEPAPSAATQPVETADAGGTSSGDGVTSIHAMRDEALSPLQRELVRKAKRALQDAQNELLDRLRKQKGRATAVGVLADADEETEAWAELLVPAVGTAYLGGFRTHAASAPHGPPPDLVTALAASIAAPLRERLVVAIDDAADDETGDDAALRQRIGARFREYKGRQLQDIVGDALATAWVRGVYDGLPEGSRLRWVPAVEGRCPDCDDNALEPTVRGDAFPTGQLWPPAHPGCRCLLVPVDEP